MAHEEDPLDEIGDLVGKTLDILGAVDDPYAGQRALNDDGRQKAGHDVSGMQSLTLEDLDLLAHSSSTQAADKQDPLSQHKDNPYADDHLLQGQAPDNPDHELLQAAHRYEDLQDDSHVQGHSPTQQMHKAEPTAMSTRPSEDQAHIAGGIRVTIREPEKIETVSSLGIKTHFVTYTVRTDSSLPGLIAVGQEVKRRFSDFDSLHKFLKQEYRGYFVPPLPEKSFIASKMAQDDFIRLRRADLQAFVEGVSQHPVLKHSEAFKIFLLTPGELTRNPAWTYLVHPPASLKQQQAGLSSITGTLQDGSAAAAGSAAVANSLKAGIGSWVSWMKTSMAQFAPSQRQLPEDELQLRQAKELLVDLGQLLELTVEAARQLCGNQESLCVGVRELSRCLALLSRYEEAVQSKVGQYTEQGTSAAARAMDLNKMAYGTAKQQQVLKSLSLRTAASLVKLHDYFVLVPEAIAALEVRENALTNLHVLEDELAAKQQALEQATAAANKIRVLPNVAAPSTAEQRSYQLGTAISQLQDKIKAASKEYEEVKQRNQSELARLHLTREQDFRRMFAHFARTQAELVSASAQIWVDLARQFEHPTPSNAVAGTEQVN